MQSFTEIIFVTMVNITTKKMHRRYALHACIPAKKSLISKK